MFDKNPFVQKRRLKGRLVVVLDDKLDLRKLHLIDPISRVIAEKEVHEFIITDEHNCSPGDEVNSIAYLGFVEFQAGGVLVRGDKLYAEDNYIGTIIGFDNTHYPNHLNILIERKKKQTGLELGLQIEDEISIITD